MLLKLVRYHRAEILTGAFFLLAAGCAPLASVRERSASLGYTADHDQFAFVRKHLADAAKIEEKEPLAALSHDLAAAERMAAELRKRPNDSNPRKLYNFAVARAVENIQRAGVAPWHRRITVSGPAGRYSVSG